MQNKQTFLGSKIAQGNSAHDDLNLSSAQNQNMKLQTSQNYAKTADSSQLRQMTEEF